MKKNSNSQTKSGQKTKPTKARGPVQRDSKEVMAELVAKLSERLGPKPAPENATERKPNGAPSPNRDRLTVGVDLGDQWSNYCILGLEGETLAEGQVRTTREDVAAFFQVLSAARVVFEVGMHSAWVREVVVGCGHEVLVANPRLMDGSKRRKRKNDRIDAKKLARLGRVDPQSLFPMEHRGTEVRQDLVVLRARDTLVQVRTQLINATRGLVKSMGARLPKCSSPSFPKKVEEALPAEVREALLPLVRLAEELSDQIRERVHPETKIAPHVSRRLQSCGCMTHFHFGSLGISWNGCPTEVVYFLCLRLWMDGRKRTFFYCSLLVAAIAASSCGMNQQSKFQMALLPPAPKSLVVPEADIADIPVPPPNKYLQDLPAVLLSTPKLPPKPTAGDAMADRAARRYEAGKKLYQMKDLPGARREFDAAVDLMLQASDSMPADRVDYERKLDEMVESIHHFDLSGLGASAAIEEGKFEKAPLEDILQMTFPVDPKLSTKVREQVRATVSQLPLSVNDAVLGYINYFANRGHQTLVAGYERSGRYRPMIQRVLQEEGIPQELIHLAQAESGFIPRAVSRKAAGGMWQFVVFRGQQYGLMQTRYTDDRMDPEMATRAAARHLHDLYNEFGDWYLAIAGYNCGPGAVEKAVERTGYADFWELRDRGALPAETTNYVPIILAMTIMEKNAAEYGLEGLPFDAPVEYDTVTTEALTSLTLVSDITDLSTAELAEINPAALKGVVPDGYALHVPKGMGNAVAEALAKVPAERRAAWRMHRVGPEETLASIGKRYGVSAASIVGANKLASDTPVEGDRLLIPAPVRVEAARTAPARTAAARSTATPAAASKRTVSHRAHAAGAKTTANAAQGKAVAHATPAKPASVIVARVASR